MCISSRTSTRILKFYQCREIYYIFLYFIFFFVSRSYTNFHRFTPLLVLRFALLGPAIAFFDFEDAFPFDFFFAFPPLFFFSFWVRLSNHRLSCSKVKLHSFASFLIYSCRAFMVPLPLGNTFSVNMRSNLSRIFFGSGTRLRRITILLLPLAIFNM